jgi:diguanylate cyclase (GGDEF)-like protein/PAS domain S-box-containing protein
MQGPAVFTVGPLGKITSWNSECEQLLGYTAAAAIQRPFASLLAAADARACSSQMKSMRNTTSRMWVRVRHANGSMLRCALTLSPQYRDGDKFGGFNMVMQTEEAPAPAPSEMELISRITLKDMVDLLPVTFYVISQAGKLVLWNTRVEQATQLGNDELRVVAAIDMFAPEDRPLVAARIAEVFTEDGEVIVEAGLLSRDGRITPYLLTGTRFTIGASAYLCGMGMDLTDRRRQEEQLRLRERALHASSNGIFIVRANGNFNPIEYVNPAFERITGYRAAETLGRDSDFMCGFLAMPETDLAEHADVRRALLEKRETRVTFRNLRKTGEMFWNDLTVAPVLDDKGNATHFIGVINDVTESKQRTFFLEHEINHDVLTGLANRNLMWDRLEQAIHMAQRNKTLVATILVDLDHFKVINDTLGHEAGDEVLKVIARKMLASVRESDTVARLGGDEFVLILTNQPSLRFTLRMIDRLRADIAMAVTLDGKEIAVASSMGVSIFPHDGKTAAELIQSADAAMYHAKSAGRNDVHFFSLDMKATTEAKHKLEQHMRQAIANDEIFIVLQPKVSLKTGRIVGAEALLRWRHPQQGVLLPGAFIREAEENGMIIQFGEWVFGRVCDALTHLKLLGFDGLVISMNVSFRELSQHNYIPLLGLKLADSALAPESFELEITESNLLKNAELTQGILGDIERLGIRLTVDEFGAGMSSLKNLQQLPVTNLKIFKSYIDNITRDNVSDMMAKTIIGIGHLMNVGVIGEGVETAGQHDFLKLNGCDQIQGNYFSEPIPLPMFERLLSATNRGPLH